MSGLMDKAKDLAGKAGNSGSGDSTQQAGSGSGVDSSVDKGMYKCVLVQVQYKSN